MISDGGGLSVVKFAFDLICRMRRLFALRFAMESEGSDCWEICI